MTIRPRRIRACLGPILFFILFTYPFFPAFPQAIIIDHNCTDLSQIPDAWITQAKNNLHVSYQHTSHGSQLVTGMTALENFPAFGTKYEWSDDGSAGLDLDDYGIPGAEPDLSQGDYIDENGVTPWVTATRNLLDDPANSHVNVVMWSWCSINLHHPQRYVDNMEILVSEYPGVYFIFMTGHAQGQGENLYDDPQPDGTGHVHYNNELIRQHCLDNNRILFDFADIESYDPDGSYFWDLNMEDDLDYTEGNWGQEWIDANPGSELEQLTTGNGVSGYGGCGSCAHCEGPDNKARINCVLKGRGVWWMMARLAGWNGLAATPTPQPPPTATPTPGCSPCMVMVWGTVYDGGTLEPIAGAYVELNGHDWIYTWFGSDFTNQDGDYLIEGGCCCGGGEGTVAAGAWGYHTGLEEISHCCVNNLRFYLNPMATPTPSPTPIYNAVHSADFDGDGTAEIALYRPGSSLWAVRGLTRCGYGGSGDLPVSGDYDGDGTAEIGVFRGSSGLWGIRGLTRLYYGSNGDLPVPGDYEGDGCGDVAIFRQAGGLWALKGITRLAFGIAGDRPVPGDYDGDGTDDIALFRGGSGLWILKNLSRFCFGSLGDLPLPRDYGGDGSCLPAVFHPETGKWSVYGSTRRYFGVKGDLPLAADYDGDSHADITLFRASSGLWAVRGFSRFYYGKSGDLPVAR